jgi:hypothetical protein
LHGCSSSWQHNRSSSRNSNNRTRAMGFCAVARAPLRSTPRHPTTKTRQVAMHTSWSRRWRWSVTCAWHLSPPPSRGQPHLQLDVQGVKNPKQNQCVAAKRLPYEFQRCFRGHPECSPRQSWQVLDLCTSAWPWRPVWWGDALHAEPRYTTESIEFSGGSLHIDGGAGVVIDCTVPVGGMQWSVHNGSIYTRRSCPRRCTSRTSSRHSKYPLTGELRVRG